MTNFVFITNEERDELVTSIDRLLTRVNGTSPLDDPDMQEFITDMVVLADYSMALGVATTMDDAAVIEYFANMVKTAADNAERDAKTIDEKSKKIISGQLVHFMMNLRESMENRLK